MKHAFATFVFTAASIAAFAGSAYALPLPVNPFAEAARGDVAVHTTIALDQGANQWNHKTEATRGEAVKLATIRWNGYTDNAEFDEVDLRKKKHWVSDANDKLALDQGANQWNHRDDDSRVNPRLVL
jgi:hypothetical protein